MEPEVAFPDTPAAQLLKTYLAAIRDGDRAALQAFNEKDLTRPIPGFVDQSLEWRALYGGFELKTVEESTELHFRGLVEAPIGGMRFRFIVDLEQAPPHRISTILLQPASGPGEPPPPPDLTAAEEAAARAQPAFLQFSAWLAAFNSGDRGQLEKFLEKNFPVRLPSLDREMRFRDNTGGFELRKLEQASATRVSGLVQERASDQFARFTLVVTPDAQHLVAGLDLDAVPRPAAFAISRLTEDGLIEALKAQLDKVTAANIFSGTVLVAKDGKVLFQGAYGLADRDKKVPNTLQTRFRIGSMNKMFTAVSILQLVQAGKIKLTDPVGKYIPDYPNKDIAAKVTIHELLTHTGGTGDIFGPEFQAHRTTLRTLDDYVKLYGTRGPQFDPGSQWSYSNYGMLLLGVVIEKVSGESYYSYVRDHVYKPAGMTRTGSLPEDKAVPGRSVGYMRSPTTNSWVPNTDTLPYRGTSAGGGYSTVDDLFKFAHALTSHKLLNAHYTSLLLAPKVAIPGPGGLQQAYGFEGRQDTDANACMGHSGGAPGMNGDLRIYLESGYVVAVLSNLDPPAAQHISDFIDIRMPTMK